MDNLIAYIPVPNQMYVNWFAKHLNSHLQLIPQSMAEKLLPRLVRNVGALPADMVVRWATSERLVANAKVLDSEKPNLQHIRYFMPDEDISHEFVSKFLDPSLTEFESVWGRWDMTAVRLQEPIIPDLEVSQSGIDLIRMSAAKKLAPRSPDWWRQIAAVAFRAEGIVACSYNEHYPDEYETVIFGDPRLCFDAGDPAGFEIYLSRHAEKGILTGCAKKGTALEGASVYVTTFPCGDCAHMLADCCIKELIFDEGYSVLKGLETLRSRGIRVVKVKSPESA